MWPTERPSTRTAQYRRLWQRAYTQFRGAIRRGELVPPAHCEECGRKRRVEGHHCDHMKPLDVEWVCPKCHGYLRGALLLWGDMPASMRLAVRAKAKRDGISLRTLILRLLSDWLKAS
jgi:hypothetical protein